MPTIFYTAHLQGKYGERQDVIDAAPEYYNKKFKNLAKIPLSTSEVSDTIGWIMPALVDIFSSTEDVVKVQGVSGNDTEKAQSIQDLLNYQTERLNDGFMNRYYWILSCLQYNIGFKKKTWLREYKAEQKTGVFNNEEIAQLEQNSKIKIKKESLLSEGNGFDISPLYQVDYEERQVLKNQPLDEVYSGNRTALELIGEESQGCDLCSPQENRQYRPSAAKRKAGRVF